MSLDPRKLNSRDRKIAIKHMLAENKKFGRELLPLPKDKWGQSALESNSIIAVYRSKDFLVQVHNESARHHSGLVRLSILRTAINPHTGDWVDGITWDQMQWIKNNVGFAFYDAVEVFPSINDLVNVANIRHLWVFKEACPLDIVWRSEWKTTVISLDK